MSVTTQPNRMSEHICPTSRRLRGIQHACEREHQPKRPAKLPTMLVDSQHGVAYCFIEKISSSTWKRLMSRATAEGQILPPLDHAHYPKQLHKYGLDTRTVSNADTNLTKFLVVRNPFDRLISAHMDKLTFTPGYDRNGYWQLVRKDIIRTFGATPSRKQETDTAAKFSEFITMIVSRGKYSRDKHWAPYADRYAPCHVTYDYVMRVETLRPDAKPVLALLNQTQDSLDQFSSNIMRNSTFTDLDTKRLEKRDPFVKKLSLFKEISNKTLEKLLNIYRLDFELFGYHFNQSSFLASCSISNSFGNCC